MKAVETPPIPRALAACASQPRLPIAPGTYRFQQRFAAQPSMEGAELASRIEGRRIELANDGDSSVFTRGVETGPGMWQARSRQSIIGSGPADAKAGEVDGCSDRPAVVDRVARICRTR